MSVDPETAAVSPAMSRWRRLLGALLGRSDAAPPPAAGALVVPTLDSIAERLRGFPQDLERALILLGGPISVLVESGFDLTLLTRFTLRAYVVDIRLQRVFRSELVERMHRESLRRGWLDEELVLGTLGVTAKGEPPAPAPARRAKPRHPVRRDLADPKGACLRRERDPA